VSRNYEQRRNARSTREFSLLCRIGDFPGVLNVKLARQTRGVRLANVRYAHCERKTDFLKMLSEKGFLKAEKRKTLLQSAKAHGYVNSIVRRPV